MVAELGDQIIEAKEKHQRQEPEGRASDEAQESRFRRDADEPEGERQPHHGGQRQSSAEAEIARAVDFWA